MNADDNIYFFNFSSLAALSKTKSDPVPEINIEKLDLYLDQAFKPWEEPKCDCGAETCKTTHALWCSTK